MGQWIIPFITALVISYAFHVPSLRLSKLCRISSVFSAAIIVFGLVSLFSLFTVFLIPTLKNAIVILMQKLPYILHTFPIYINDTLHKLLSNFGFDYNVNYSSVFTEYINTFALNLPKHIFGFIDTGMTLIYIVMFVFMTPIITFYLLKDWIKFETSFVALLDKFASPTFISIIKPLNSKLGSYIKGQLVVCLILASAYTTGLYVIGIERFFVCGLISGMLAIAPFFGALIGALTTFATSLNSLQNHQYFLLLSLYLLIPFLDSNFITPRFIGRSTGINPVWLLFSICICTSVLGATGIFISVPTAVIISCLCKECVKRYKR